MSDERKCGRRSPTREELRDAVVRTANSADLFDGIDVGAIAKKSSREYWAEKEAEERQARKANGIWTRFRTWFSSLF